MKGVMNCGLVEFFSTAFKYRINSAKCPYFFVYL